MENKLNKKAAAIRYSSERKVPIITAQGKGFVAEKIIEKAQENNVPTYEDSVLVTSLLELDIGKSIPPELYEVVAKILFFVCDIEKLRSKIND